MTLSLRAARERANAFLGITEDETEQLGRDWIDFATRHAADQVSAMRYGTGVRVPPLPEGLIGFAPGRYFPHLMGTCHPGIVAWEGDDGPST